MLKHMILEVLQPKIKNKEGAERRVGGGLITLFPWKGGIEMGDLIDDLW